MSDLDEFLAVLAAHDDRQQGIEAVYQQLDNAGLINRVVVHRFICQRRGCKLGTVIRVHGLLILRTEPYKLAPRTNLEKSVEAARRSKTLDGDRYWPGHTVDVDYHNFDEQMSFTMNCRCRERSVRVVDIISAVGDARPGHPGAPSRL